MNSAAGLGQRASILSMLVNLLFCMVKIVSGILGNSYALVADGIESFADIFSSFIVWNGIRISSNPPDRGHPYGHGKAESLAGLFAALILAFSAVIIAYNSFGEILNPHSMPAPFTLAVAGGVIVGKIAMWRWMMHQGNRINSTAIKTDAWHHLSDALTTSAVFIGLSVAFIGGEGYENADDYAALLICIFIVYNAYNLAKPSVGEIMDANVEAELHTAIRNESLGVQGVQGIDKLRIRKSGLEYFVDIQVEVQAELTVREGHAIGHRVKHHLINSDIANICDVHVHIEPYQQS